jgi:AcrR family transcriptional regulator
VTIPANILRASLDDALEVVALTDTARDLGADALTDVMSLSEPQRTRLLEVLRRCWELNAEIMAAAQRLSRQMDEVERLADRPPSVKELAAELRPHLTVIADPPSDDGDAYVEAVYALRDLIDATPFDRLAGGGMRRALGPGRHALLMGFVEGHAEPFLLAQHNMTHLRAGGEACASTAIPPEGAGLATSLEEVAA